MITNILLLCLLPILWLACYLFRVVFYDIVDIIIEVISDLLAFHPLIALLRLLTAILTLPLDIICGLFITLYLSISYAISLIKGRMDKSSFMKSFFRRPKYNTYHFEEAKNSKVRKDQVVASTDGEDFDNQNINEN